MRIVNRLRTLGGACAATAPPLVRKLALDVAASHLANGTALNAALKSAGYRMTQVQVITVSGEGLGARLEPLLASRYCAQIGSPKLSEAGVHERGNQMWIVLAAPFAPKADLSREQLARRMLTLVNKARAEARDCGDKHFQGTQPVRWNADLASAADGHATDMAANSYFSHTGRDGSTPAQRVTRAGYRFRMTAENIAAGQSSPEEAVAGWIKSPGHCANLMNGGYSEMGVAFSVNAASEMGVYWVQNFGTQRQ